MAQLDEAEKKLVEFTEPINTTIDENDLEEDYNGESAEK